MLFLCPSPESLSSIFTQKIDDQTKITNNFWMQTLDILYTGRLQVAHGIFTELDHPIRKRILYLLHEDPGICVTDIYISLSLGQSICSQHLSRLSNAGIIKAERIGKFIFYKINEDFLSAIADFLISTIDDAPNDYRKRWGNKV